MPAWKLLEGRRGGSVQAAGHPGGGLGTALQREFAEDMAHVYLYGALREMQSSGNGRIAHALGQQGQHFPLARCERVPRRDTAPDAAERLADHFRIGTRIQTLCDCERDV